MAEPTSIGYKRRKGLPDLKTPNELYAEGIEPNISTVLYHFQHREGMKADATLGFNTTIQNILSRETMRLDPKYRWLWDYEEGVIIGPKKSAIPLSEYFQLVPLEKIKAGELDEETLLVDLDNVVSRSGEINGDCNEVTSIRSDKVSFYGADILMSKLEPYLGKLIVDPPQNAIGTTEWIGLKCKKSINHRVAGYFLMLPEMCGAYRRLQSGKRHARLEARELLEMRVNCAIENISSDKIAELDIQISNGKAQLKCLRSQIDHIIVEN